MRKADLTTRAVAGFVDLLLIIGLARLPDVLGFLSASGYLLIRDGLFQGRSVGKKLIGLVVSTVDDTEVAGAYRESLIRNATLVGAYLLFLIPYAGWVLGPLALGMECLVAIGDERGMRVGDMLARTFVAQPDEVVAGKNNTAEARQESPSEPAGQQDAAQQHNA